MLIIWEELDNGSLSGVGIDFFFLYNPLAHLYIFTLCYFIESYVALDSLELSMYTRLDFRGPSVSTSREAE